MAFNTPILFLIFNRADLTEQVFHAIKLLQPRYLYVAADGPRNNVFGEYEKCNATRQNVLHNIDWECEVKTLLREENLGCGEAVLEAITWFFEHVEEGIILEDDCLPHKSFFHFCDEMLNRYRDNNKVMHIGGTNFQNKNRAGQYSYYYSHYIHIWGWATWKRAWQLYSFDIPASDNGYKQILKKIFNSRLEREVWKISFEGMAKHSIDTWDIQWVYTIYKNRGIGITPVLNLVSNIGFRPDATHTQSIDNGNANLPLFNISNLVHPKKIKVLLKADQYSFKTQFQNGHTYYNKLKIILIKRLPILKSLFLKYIRNNH